VSAHGAEPAVVVRFDALVDQPSDAGAMMRAR
jgi:hypothetical protein